MSPYLEPVLRDNMLDVSSPYDPPTVGVVDEREGSAPRFDPKRRAKLALALGLAPLGSIAFALLLSYISAPQPIYTLVLATGWAATVVGFSVAVHAVWSLARTPRPLRPAGMGLAIAAIPMGLLGWVVGAVSTLLSVASFSRGRQLRRFGRPQFAPLSPESPWQSTRAPQPGPRSSAAAAVGEAWRANGSTEHASVAAFARLSIELVALGAPPKLIADAHKDALDEMRHTELCFDLAHQLDGVTLGPGAFERATKSAFLGGPRGARLARLAVDSLIDGALNEGVSARVVAELSKTAEDPRTQEVLRSIARDEARHAMHGFEVMRWCVEEGGIPVARALESTLAVLPHRPKAGLLPEAADGRWERFGIPGRAREEQAFRVVRSKLVARVGRLLSEAGAGQVVVC